MNERGEDLTVVGGMVGTTEQVIEYVSQQFENNSVVKKFGWVWPSGGLVPQRNEMGCLAIALHCGCTYTFSVDPLDFPDERLDEVVVELMLFAASEVLGLVVQFGTVNSWDEELANLLREETGG